MTKFYPQEDVQQILQLAIARQAESEELSHEQLVEIASELGISSDNLEAAEQAWQIQRKEQEERQAFRKYQHRKWQQHLIQYLLVNSGLILLDILTAPSYLPSWSIYVVLFWGLGLIWDGWYRYQAQGEKYERSFQWWRRKQQLNHSVNRLLDKVFNT